MANVNVGDVVKQWRQWSSGSVDELAAVGTVFVWTLGLEPLPETTASDRVTRRTIRYYISRDLMDSPEGERRLAIYRYRHLLQLLYIKARQHAGDRLDQIRSNLAGLDRHGLESLLFETLPVAVPPPLPEDPSEFARPAQLHAVLGRWAFLTGRRGRWRPVAARQMSPEMGPQVLVSDEVQSRNLQYRQLDAPVARPLRLPAEQGEQALRHRVEISIGDGVELSLPADHPLVHDEDGRRLILRGIQRMMRDYLRGNGPA